MSLINIEKLSIGYDSHCILENISFSVNAGDYLCIIGENGAGKSTLMKTMLGLQAPLGGNIILGEGLNKRNIGYLPQQTAVQKDFPASVKEIVISGCQGHYGFHPFYNKNDKRLAEKSMNRMEISNLCSKNYRELSGGQQQRVLLARTLCATEKLILLDEPTSSLDPKATMEMYELIDKINNEGITVIMISHDIINTINYASHILHIGKSVFYGTKDEYLSSNIESGFLVKGNKTE